MCSSKEKQETDSENGRKTMVFGNKKCPGIENLSSGRSGRTTGSPTV
jgi:hypothetical protein